MLGNYFFKLFQLLLMPMLIWDRDMALVLLEIHLLSFRWAASWIGGQHEQFLLGCDFKLINLFNGEYFGFLFCILRINDTFPQLAKWMLLIYSIPISLLLNLFYDVLILSLKILPCILSLSLLKVEVLLKCSAILVNKIQNLYKLR